ncbi:MAG TPA: DcrB-related protein, partial [Herpetosiphonaceae bacterium]
ETSGASLISYQDETYPFTIDLPSDWFIQEVEDDTYAVLVVSSDSEGDDHATIAVVVEALDDEAQLSDVIATTEQTLAAQYDIEEFNTDLARPIQINSVPGEERIYAYRVDSAPVRQRTAYIREGSYLYTISLVASPALSSRYAELFDGVLASFTGA